MIITHFLMDVWFLPKRITLNGVIAAVMDVFIALMIGNLLENQEEANYYRREMVRSLIIQPIKITRYNIKRNAREDLATLFKNNLSVMVNRA